MFKGRDAELCQTGQPVSSEIEALEATQLFTTNYVTVLLLMFGNFISYEKVEFGPAFFKAAYYRDPDPHKFIRGGSGSADTLQSQSLRAKS